MIKVAEMFGLWAKGCLLMYYIKKAVFIYKVIVMDMIYDNTFSNRKETQTKI